MTELADGFGDKRRARWVSVGGQVDLVKAGGGGLMTTAVATDDQEP